MGDQKEKGAGRRERLLALISKRGTRCPAIWIREFCMLKPACIALSISALVYGFGGQAALAGWSDAASGLTLSASSLVISVKKNKRNDNDDNDDNGNKQNANNKGKHKKHDDDDNEHEANDKAPSTTTKPKCDVLWGDYCQ